MNKGFIVVCGVAAFALLLGGCSSSQSRMDGAYQYDPNYDAYYRSRIEAAYTRPSAPPVTPLQPASYYQAPMQAMAAPQSVQPLQMMPNSNGGYPSMATPASLEQRMAELEDQMERVIAFNKSLRVQLQQALNYIEDTKVVKVSAASSVEQAVPQKVVLYQPPKEELVQQRAAPRATPKAGPQRVSIKAITPVRQDTPMEEGSEILSMAFSYKTDNTMPGEPESFGGKEKYLASYDVLIRAESKAEMTRLDKFLLGHGVKDRFKSGKGGAYRIFLGTFSSPEAAAERRAEIKGQTGLEPTIIRRLIGGNA